MNAIINTYARGQISVVVVGRIAPTCRGGMIRCRVQENVSGYTKNVLYDFNPRDIVGSVDLSGLPEVEW